MSQMRTAAVGPAGPLRHSPGLIIAVLSLTGITASSMQTVIMPILPHLPGILSARAEDVTWVLTVALILGAVGTPICGRLGDMIGKRRMLLLSLASMLLGSVLCATANGLTQMIIGRAFQGIALGAVSLAISLMRDVLPAVRLGKGVAVISGLMGVGGAVGMPLAAVFAQYFNWRVPFVIVALLAVTALVSIWLLVPESHIRTGGRFDLTGSILLSAVLGSLLFGLTKAKSWGWDNPTVHILFVTAAVLFVLFVIIELRIANPLVDIRVSRARAVLFTNLTGMAIGFGMYSFNLVLTQLLQAPTSSNGGFGASMIVSALCGASLGFMMLSASPFAARMIDRWGPRFTLRVGICIMGVGFALPYFFLFEPWHAVFAGALVGAGTTCAMASFPMIIMRSVDDSQTAAANGVNNLSRSLGLSLSSAIHGTILAATIEGKWESFGSLAPADFSWILTVLACLLALVITLGIPRKLRLEPGQTGVPDPEVAADSASAAPEIAVPVSEVNARK